MRSRGFLVEIRSPNFALTPALREYAMNHLAGKLRKHDQHIQHVILRLENANRSAAGDGADMVCRVEVVLAHHEPLVIEEVDHDLRAAIDFAADRVEQAVQRDAERLRVSRRHRQREVVRQLKLEPLPR